MTPVAVATLGLVALAIAGFLVSIPLGVAVVGIELLAVGLLADFGEPE